MAQDIARMSSSCESKSGPSSPPLAERGSDGGERRDSEEYLDGADTLDADVIHLERDSSTSRLLEFAEDGCQGERESLAGRTAEVNERHTSGSGGMGSRSSVCADGDDCEGGGGGCKCGREGGDAREAGDAGEGSDADNTGDIQDKSPTEASRHGPHTMMNNHDNVDSLDGQNYVFYRCDRHRTKWEEAAIFVLEGEDNEKFIRHPRGRWSKRAFEVLHHPGYYITHLVVTILLMALVLAENYPTSEDCPISDQARLAIQMTSVVLEFLFLSFISVHIILKLVWFGPRKFITSKGALLQTIILVVLLLEVFTVFIRQRTHLRVTRALRPAFLLDNVLMNGVRREVRDVFKSLKPIFDVLFLLIFIVLMFALLGYYYLAEIDPSYFDGFQRSFVSLYILMTTANNPDVMLEAYNERPASVIFFIIYLICTVYFVINMLTAVIFSSFSDADKTKFKKLYLHKRKALQLAYDALAKSEGISFHDFLPLVQKVRPQLRRSDIMCVFKALHKHPEQVEQHSYISLEEFYNFYEILDLSWKRVYEDGTPHWYEQTYIFQSCQRVIKACHRLVMSKPFKITVFFTVVLNVVVVIIFVLATNDFPSEDRFENLRRIYAIAFIFTLFYCVEIVLKVIGYGPHNYYSEPLNIIDSIIIFISFFLLLSEARASLVILAAARPIKLFRLLKLKHQYRDFVWTVLYLAPKMATVAIFLTVVNYSFAIIGLEFFNEKVFRGCCNESWYNIRSFYSGNIIENTTVTDNVSPSADIYYLLNFNDIGSSYVTLFTLMIGNNWHVIMEGFASESQLSWLVRFYFLSFNIITLVIFEVAIAFIVEAFVYSVHARQKDRYCRKHKKSFKYCKCVIDQSKNVRITLVQADLDEIAKETESNTAKLSIRLKLFRFRQEDNTTNAHTKTYVGHRLLTKVDIQLQMYESLFNEWILEAEEGEEGEDENHSEDGDGEKKLTLKTIKRFMVKLLNRIYDFILE